MFFDFCVKYKIRNGWIVYPLSILSFLFMQHTDQTIGSGGSNHRDAGKMVNRYLDYSLFVRKKSKTKTLSWAFLHPAKLHIVMYYFFLTTFRIYKLSAVITPFNKHKKFLK